MPIIEDVKMPRILFHVKYNFSPKNQLGRSVCLYPVTFHFMFLIYLFYFLGIIIIKYMRHILCLMIVIWKILDHF